MRVTPPPIFGAKCKWKTIKRDKSTSRDFVARGRPLRGQTRLAPLAKRSTCSKSTRNPNLQVAIMHGVSCMWQAFVWTSSENERNAQNAIWSRAFGLFFTRNLITRVLTICHVQLPQSIMMSPALRNLWLLLGYSILIMVHHVRLSSTWSAHQLLSEVSQTRLTIPEIDTFISDPTMHKGP